METKGNKAIQDVEASLTVAKGTRLSGLLLVALESENDALKLRKKVQKVTSDAAASGVVFHVALQSRANLALSMELLDG